MEVSAQIKINAETQQKGQEKIMAAIKIIKALPHEDLLHLAQIAEKKPNFVQKAKPFEHLL